MAKYIVKDANGNEHTYETIDKARGYAISVLMRDPSKKKIIIMARRTTKSKFNGNEYQVGIVFKERNSYWFTKDDNRQWSLKRDGSLYGCVEGDINFPYFRPPYKN